MADPTAYDAMAQEVWSHEIAPAFTDALMGMGQVWRTAE